VASSRRLQQNQQSVEVMREKCLVAERRAAAAEAALAEATARESAAAAATHSEAGWAAALTALPGVSSAADVIHQVGELQRAVAAAQAAAVRSCLFTCRRSHRVPKPQRQSCVSFSSPLTCPILTDTSPTDTTVKA